MKSMNLLVMLAVGAGFLSVPALALENAVKTQLTAVKNAPAHTSADYKSILAGLPAQDFADALSYLLNDLMLPLAEVTAIANSAIATMDAGKQVECVETVNDTVPSIIIDDSSLKDEAKTELAARAAARLAAAIFNTPAKAIIDNPRGTVKGHRVGYMAYSYRFKSHKVQEFISSNEEIHDHRHCRCVSRLFRLCGWPA